MPSSPSADISRELLEYLSSRRAAMLERLREWVEIETPSGDKQALARLGRAVADQFAELGCRIIPHPDGCYGDHIEAIAEPGPEGLVPAKKLNPCTKKAFQSFREITPGLLVLGHLDTVYPEGTLAQMPFTLNGERARGPGTLDMKAGIVMALYALEGIARLKLKFRHRIAFLWVTDEEVGSNGSRILTEARARHATAVLVMEPSSGPRGALKTARKGIAHFTITARGRSAHAGVDFEKGASAIVELCHQVGLLAKLTDKQRGVTVNPGVITGGTRSNVIAAEASVEVDVRAWTTADLIAVTDQIRSLRAADGKVQLEIRGAVNRPPMERKLSAVLFEQARGMAGELGWTAEESATGGGSDGNFTAALGIPTLDGLGAVGEGAHSPGENILLEPLVPRTALLALLLTRL